MNYELLRGKYLLLDANFIINYANHPKEMEVVALKLEEYETIPVLDEFVRFEYIRGAASPKEIEILKTFLMRLFRLTQEDVDKPQFPVTPDVFIHATNIANIYSNRLKNLNAPTVDCFLAAQMKKYGNKLILVTSDHKDFPSLLFDRIRIETIDTGSEIINIGFYVLNEDRYSNAFGEFHKK